jgi:hypothetical protein
VQEFYPEPAEHEQMERVIHSYVANLQRKNTSKNKIYELLAELHPLLGNPVTLYEEFAYNESYKNCKSSKEGRERS